MEKKSKFPKFIIIFGVIAMIGVCVWYLFFRTVSPPEPGFSSSVKKFDYEDITLNKDDVSDKERDFSLENNPDYEVKYVKRKAEASFDTWSTIGVSNDILFPGQLLDLSGEAVKPLALGSAKRAPITISTNLEGVVRTDGQSGRLSQTVDANLSSVRNGISTIVNSNIPNAESLPSVISVDFYEVESAEEFYLNIGLGLSIGGFELADNFDLSNIKQQTNMVVVLKHVYYTIDCDYMGFDGLFSPLSTSVAIEKAFKETVPAYVSSVSYGKMAILTIQTDYSVNDIKNALSFGYNTTGSEFLTEIGIGDGVNIDANFQKLLRDKNTKISYYQYGGTSQASEQILTADTKDALKSFFATSNNGDGALPLSYVIRNLDGTTAAIQKADEYVVKEITYKPAKLMNWDEYISLLETEEIKGMDSLVLDLGGVVNYRAPDESATNASITLTIPKNIKTLTLRGPNETSKEIVYQNLSVFLQGPIHLILDNISFIGREGQAAIYTGNTIYDFDVECKGRVYVQGGKGVAGLIAFGDADIKLLEANADATFQGGEGLQGKEGNEAILSTGKVSVLMADHTNLTLHGGKGGTGREGDVGANGGRGGNGGLAITANSFEAIYTGENPLEKRSCAIVLCGGDGGTGGAGGRGIDGKLGGVTIAECSGGDGGRGGDGGDGMSVVKQIEEKEDLTAVKVQFLRGNGGDGGRGGDGGNGVEGLGNIKQVAGIPENGGHGGKGGRGGDGGDGKLAGRGGDGGNGGNGDNSGWNLHGSVETRNGGDGGDGGDSGSGEEMALASKGGQGGEHGDGSNVGTGLFSTVFWEGTNGKPGNPGVGRAE